MVMGVTIFHEFGFGNLEKLLAKLLRVRIGGVQIAAGFSWHTQSMGKTQKNPSLFFSCLVLQVPLHRGPRGLVLEVPPWRALSSHNRLEWSQVPHGNYGTLQHVGISIRIQRAALR